MHMVVLYAADCRCFSLQDRIAAPACVHEETCKSCQLVHHRRATILISAGDVAVLTTVAANGRRQLGWELDLPLRLYGGQSSWKSPGPAMHASHGASNVSLAYAEFASTCSSLVIVLADFDTPLGWLAAPFVCSVGEGEAPAPPPSPLLSSDGSVSGASSGKSPDAWKPRPVVQAIREKQVEQLLLVL